STIVFTNSRRLAERLTARLNELAAEPDQLEEMVRFPAEAVGQSGIASGAPPVLARAHHGSMSREQRTGGEEDLKSGRLPCVLAQHGVAMVAVEPWTVTELTGLVRRAAPFAGLPDSALHAVLDMLSGRYPSEEFGELRPRITWDRITGELRGRPGAQRLAVTS